MRGLDSLRELVNPTPVPDPIESLIGVGKSFQPNGNGHEPVEKHTEPVWEPVIVEHGDQLVAKVSDEDQAVEVLKAAGARRAGKTLRLDLGQHGEVRYTPVGTPYAGAAERGVIRVSGPEARRTLDRLKLTPLLAASDPDDSGGDT